MQESTSLFSIMEQFAYRHPEWWLAAGAVLLLLMLLLLVQVRRYMMRTAEQRLIKQMITRTAVQFLPNVELPDEVEGAIHVDYLLLMPNGIVVVDIQNCRGILFGSDRTDTWSQLVGRKSYKFDNPLPFNQTRVQNIKLQLGEKVPVEGRVVFSSAGSFPKGVPKGVSMIDSLKNDLAHLEGNGDVQPVVKEGWEKLRSRARQVAPVRARERDLF